MAMGNLFVSHAGERTLKTDQSNKVKKELIFTGYYGFYLNDSEKKDFDFFFLLLISLFSNKHNSQQK